MIFVLSIFEWPLKTGFTVFEKYACEKYPVYGQVFMLSSSKIIRYLKTGGREVFERAFLTPSGSATVLLFIFAKEANAKLIKCHIFWYLKTVCSCEILRLDVIGFY